MDKHPTRAVSKLAGLAAVAAAVTMWKFTEQISANVLSGPRLPWWEHNARWVYPAVVSVVCALWALPQRATRDVTLAYGALAVVGFLLILDLS